MSVHALDREVAPASKSSSIAPSGGGQSADQARRVSLHIDRVILEGVHVAPGQRHVLQAALEVELARLFANGSLAGLDVSTALYRIGASSIHIDASDGAPDLGRKIAGAVHRGIVRPGK